MTCKTSHTSTNSIDTETLYAKANVKLYNPFMRFLRFNLIEKEPDTSSRQQLSTKREKWKENGVINPTIGNIRNVNAGNCSWAETN